MSLTRSLVRIPHRQLPLELARLHRSLAVGAPVAIRLPATAPVTEVLTGAGFSIETTSEGSKGAVVVEARRLRTLPDTVGADLRVLVCGLNPSVYAADAGIGFARPGNRFWPAALAAGLVTVDRDPEHALVHHGVGMTDLVKRATPRADALDPEEYRAGLERLEHLARWLRPRVVCFVGLAGWRAAVDRRARPGRQGDLAGSRVYLMGSTSGLNAHASLAELTAHLRAATTLADEDR